MKKTYLLLLFSIFLFMACSNDNRFSWISIGDSITWQDDIRYNQGLEKGNKAIGYQTNIANMLNDNIRIKNEGYSGYSLAGNKKSVYSEVINLDYGKVDLITIFCGTNDFKLNVAIGDSNSDETYFYGALTKLIERIKSINPNVRIVLLTPLQRNNKGYSTENYNTVGHKLIDYVNATKEVGEKYNLQIVDLYHNSGITKDNLNLYTLDGLHPNNEGYKLIADILYKEVFSSIDTKKNSN